MRRIILSCFVVGLEVLAAITLPVWAVIIVTIALGLVCLRLYRPEVSYAIGGLRLRSPVVWEPKGTWRGVERDALLKDLRDLRSAYVRRETDDQGAEASFWVGYLGAKHARLLAPVEPHHRDIYIRRAVNYCIAAIESHDDFQEAMSDIEERLKKPFSVELET